MNALVAKVLPLRIGVIGGNQIDDKLYAQAEEVGRLLAEEGAWIVCGGMGGAMEAVCKGAAKHGGTTIGILPDDHLERANEFVKIPLATGLGYARNYIIVHNADAFIAIGGSEGTLNEMAAALNLGRTVVALGSWKLEKAGQLRRGNLVQAKSAQAAVAAALDAAKAARRKV